MEAWSIGSIYEIYKAGETFFKYCIKDKKELI